VSRILQRRVTILDYLNANDYDENSFQITQIYSVNKASDQAVIDWLPELNKIKSVIDSH
jgi:hypothetical protein